jgi:hypothetical protein
MDDPYIVTSGHTLEFRLIYNGRLLGASRTNPRSEHKHEIRRVFHDQLKFLWETLPPLSRWMIPTGDGFNREKADARLAKCFTFNGVGYVPLSWEDLEVACKLDILMLRPDVPEKNIVQGGDIDNRLKTLFDALRMPNSGEVHESPGEGREPFYCLLKDDSLINQISLTTDRLLAPAQTNEVSLVIKVNLYPVNLTTLNIELVA